MNKVILMGRLTREPEVRYSAAGAESLAIARFTLAVDRRKKDDGADFISCVAFGNTAEFIEKYVSKGTKLIVSGRIQTGSYTNKDGAKVYTEDVVVEDAEFAESKKNDSQDAKSSDGFAPMPEGMNFPVDVEDDIPFAAPTR